MLMWDMQNRTTLEQAEKNRGRSYDGKISAVEDSSPFDDGNDVDFGVEGGGVVHDPSGSDDSTSRTGECSHGGHDRCICGMAGTREG